MDAAGEDAAVADEAAGDVDSADDEAADPALADDPGGAPEPASEAVTGPDGGVVDAAYEDFLKRFEQDGGGEPSS